MPTSTSGSPPQPDTTSHVTVATAVPQASVPNDLLNKMANHHITINYIVVGILLLVLAFAGIGAWVGLKGYEKLMERAEASEKLMVQYEQGWQASQQQVKAANDLYQKEAAAHAADRAADAQKLLGLTQAMQALDARTTQQMAQVLAPGKSAQDAFSDLGGAYKGTAGISFGLNLSKDLTGEQLLGFRVPEVQQFTATKLDRDRLFSDDASLTQKLALTQKDLDSTGSDLKNLQASYAVLKDSDDKLQLANAQCQKTVTAYKKVAIKSRWQKIWAGTKKGAEIAGALLAGYELGKHL
jgi:hypothetical protein